ncbi:MAG TPA: hypothetical protein DEP23_11205 [Ruminococcaceae bacterium]|nr:hypothetical protein [Oscillospiraceae bacterium]
MKKRGIQKKILITNIMAIVIMTVLMFVAFTVYYVFEHHRQFNETTTHKTETAGAVINQITNIADNTGIQLGNNPYIKEMLTELYFDDNPSNFFLDEHVEENTIIQYLLPFLIKQDMIYRICIYNNRGDFLAGGTSVLSGKVNTFLQSSDFKHIEEMFYNTPATRIYAYSSNDALQGNRHKTSGYIRIIRPIRDTNVIHGNPMGYIEVQISTAGILNQLTEFDSEEITVYLNKQKLFANGTTLPERNTYKETTELNNGFSLTLKSHNSDENRVVFFTMGFLLLLLSFLVFSLITIQRRAILKITAPLISLFTKVQEASWDEVPKIAGIAAEDGDFDEIYELQKSFDYMLESLKDTMEKNVMMRTEKINAQMLALQAQVDPHFIHNTLTIIGALAEEGDGEKVKESCQRLSDMIRYNSDYSMQKVKISQEIENTRAYMELLKIRYEEAFQYEIRVQALAGVVQVPKFILQPIVENALKHSLKQAEYPWIISIDAYCQDKKWYLKITDNGVGVTKEAKKEVLERFHELQKLVADHLLKSMKIGGFSLINTLTRMYIYYGNEMEFQIDKNENGGTTVILGGKTDA